MNKYILHESRDACLMRSVSRIIEFLLRGVKSIKNFDQNLILAKIHSSMYYIHNIEPTKMGQNFRK